MSVMFSSKCPSRKVPQAYSQALPIHAQERRANGDPTELARYTAFGMTIRLCVTDSRKH